MSKLIILSAGHSNVSGRDRGAASNGYIEGELTVELRQLVAIELKKLGVNPIMDGNNSIYTESINYFRKLVNATSINLEFHWNSGPKTATGVETIIPANPEASETAIAERLSSLVNIYLGIPLRGDKGVKTELETHHGKLAWMRLKGINVLCEICFISNVSDMEKYQQNKFALAKAFANYLYNESKGIKTLNSGIVPVNYTVKNNDTLYSIAVAYNTTVAIIKKDNNLQSDNIYVGQQLKLTLKN